MNVTREAGYLSLLCSLFLIIMKLLMAAALLVALLSSSAMAAVSPCPAQQSCSASPGECSAIDCAKVCANFLPGGSYRGCCKNGRCCCFKYDPRLVTSSTPQDSDLNNPTGLLDDVGRPTDLSSSVLATVTETGKPTAAVAAVAVAGMVDHSVVVAGEDSAVPVPGVLPTSSPRNPAPRQ
ncbi:hypothetical protein Taro_037810 [Colocasia esculenta]|uniref:Uncharacterized protein n=1 Tax=Colocasia esculenta TaxID=4460 RepID=A0A843W6J3_COLES|nr:hypothetical protein [Colocasia esculenta]